MMSENEAENLVVIMHGPMSMRRERVLNSGRIVRDDGSHYESEQLEVKWPQKSDETGADGTFQRTKPEDFDDDRKPLVTPVAVR